MLHRLILVCLFLLLPLAAFAGADAGVAVLDKAPSAPEVISLTQEAVAAAKSAEWFSMVSAILLGLAGAVAALAKLLGKR